jgi:predicted alpha/beta-hydrolase family hydrolase
VKNIKLDYYIFVEELNEKIIKNITNLKRRKLKLTIIILAAGKGTRMKSHVVKVLHPLAGLPMISYPVQAAQALDSFLILHRAP